MAFVAAFLYLRFKEAAVEVVEDGSVHSVKMSPITVWPILASVQAVFLLSFFVFIRNIDDRFVPTFFSTDSGKTFCYKWFLKTTDEADRICIFDTHPDLYFAFEHLILQWILENWERWSEEKPEWFTQSMFERIPKHMFDAVMSEMEKKRVAAAGRRGSVRRSSFVDSSAVRASGGGILRRVNTKGERSIMLTEGRLACVAE